MKRTYQPSVLVRKRRHGFRSRMATVGGRRVLRARRAKGRARLSAYSAGSRLLPGVTSIPSRAGFLRARNYGLKAVSRGLVMQAAPNHLADWRVGFTASKKIGNAVTRNRARRRLRAVRARP